MKVLIAEDDPSLREGVSELLSELAEVRAAATVAEAMAFLRAEGFDLLVSDLRLSGEPQGGRKLVRAAREHLVPVVVSSALPEDELERLLGPDRPDAILSKPYDVEDALALADRFLGRRRELEASAGRAPAPARFEPLAPGLEHAISERTSSHEVHWFRIAPGATVELRVKEPLFGLLVHGSLRLPRAERSAGQILHAPAGFSARVSAPDGALGVKLVPGR